MTRALAALALLAACGGPDEVVPDARSAALDAAVDASPPVDGPPGVACMGGGAATVMVDLGTDAEPRAFTAAWVHTGHVTKSCFEIDVVLSEQAVVADPYLADPAVLEVAFGAPPVVGVNAVSLHLHQPDTWLTGAATLTTVDDTTATGTVTASAGAVTVDGGFTAPRCLAIFDPCI